MARGKLDPPNLDDRTWRQLVDQLQALIPHYAPEWTDRNPSDLGMTLIELFAWLVEGLIYRLNRVPEKNHIAFLNLLGITRTPARPATTWLTWKADNAAVKVPKGTQVATEQTEQIAGVVFETDADLRVLPINLVAAWLTDGNTCQDISGDLVTKPLKGHLLELDSSQSVMIALGFDQRNDEALVLHVARALASGGDKVQVEWCYSTAANSPNDWPKCPPTADETLELQQSGAVTLSVPAEWGKQKPTCWPHGPAEGGCQERFWIGMRMTVKQQIRLAHIRKLPINLVAAWLIDGNTCQDITGDLVTKPLKGHLLELDSSQSVMIALGFDQRNDEALVLHVDCTSASGGDKVQVKWCYSTAANSPNDWPKCSSTADETLELQQSGAVTLSVPAEWGKQKPTCWPHGPAESGCQERFWIGVRIKNPSGTDKQQIRLAHICELPINLVAAWLIDGNTCQDISGDLVTEPLRGHLIKFDFSRPVMIALGFDQSSNKALALDVARMPSWCADGVQVDWCYSTATDPPDAWPKCSSTADETLGLQKSGAVTLKVPADWGKQNPASWPGGPAEGSQERFWIGVRLTPSTIKQQIGLAHILFNSVSTTNALTITQPEVLGKSDGTPFKNFELAHRPLWKRPGTPDPYDHLQVEVRELQLGGAFGAWLPWTRVEQLAPGDARAYRLDPVTGTLHFGDYNASRPNGHGMIPPDGSEIRAVRYRYVDGGARGNVGSETIKVARTAIPSVTFKNPGSATGGADEEALADTLRRAPELLRGSTRAVTAEDYERLARDASPAVAKARCLPPLPKDPEQNYGGLTRHVGHVNVIVVPSAGPDVSRPQPSEELLGQVQDYLACRRPLTVPLDVVGPRYLPISIEVVIRVWPEVVPKGTKEDENAWKKKIEQATRAKIVAFLHPLAGGRQQQGWEIGQDFLIADLLEHIRPDSSVGYIETLTAKAGKTTYKRRESLIGDQQPSVWVQVDDFELLCSAGDCIEDAAKHQVKVLKVGELG